MKAPYLYNKKIIDMFFWFPVDFPWNHSIDLREGREGRGSNDNWQSPWTNDSWSFFFAIIGRTRRHRLNDAVSFPLEGLELMPYRSSPEMLQKLVYFGLKWLQSVIVPNHGRICTLGICIISVHQNGDVQRDNSFSNAFFRGPSQFSRE